MAILKNGNVIRVDAEGTTCKAIKMVKALIDDKMVFPDEYHMAFIRYNVQELPPNDPNNLDHYPLVFSGKLGKKLYVNGVTAGYGGEGPHGTLEILKLMGFSLTPMEEELITSKTYDAFGDRVEQIEKFFYKN